MRTPELGLKKTSKSIVCIFLKYFPEFYKEWSRTTNTRKEYLEKGIREIIRKELLEYDFKKALANDILKDDEIAVDAAIFRYLKNKVYRGHSRQLLIDLQEIKERNTKDYS